MRITDLERINFMIDVMVKTEDMIKKTEYSLNYRNVYNNINEWLKPMVNTIVNLEKLHNEFNEKFSITAIKRLLLDDEYKLRGKKNYKTILEKFSVFKRCFTYRQSYIDKNLGRMNHFMAFEDSRIIYDHQEKLKQEKLDKLKLDKFKGKEYTVMIENPYETIKMRALNVEDLYALLRLEYKDRPINDVYLDGKRLSNKIRSTSKVVMLTLKHEGKTVNMKAAIPTNERGFITDRCVNDYLNANYAKSKYELVRYQEYKKYEGLYNAGIKNCTLSRSIVKSNRSRSGYLNYRIGI